MAKVLANRIKTAAPTVISSTKAYGIPGRDISDIISIIRDTVEYMGKAGGIILSVDLIGLSTPSFFAHWRSLCSERE